MSLEIKSGSSGIEKPPKVVSPLQRDDDERVTISQTESDELSGSEEETIQTRKEDEIDEDQQHFEMVVGLQEEVAALGTAKATEIDLKRLTIALDNVLQFIPKKVSAVPAERVVTPHVRFPRAAEPTLVVFYETKTVLDTVLLSLLKLIESELEDKPHWLIFSIPNVFKETAALKQKQYEDIVLNISRDIGLILRDRKACSLGKNSSFGPLMSSWALDKIKTFYLTGKKVRRYEPIQKLLNQYLKAVPLMKEQPIIENLRLILTLINKWFFELFERRFFYAMQQVEEYKFSAQKVCGEWQFRFHNVENLKKLCTQRELGTLSKWLTGEKAVELSKLVTEVFSNHKYYLLQVLKKVSNSFDHLVPKSIIKILYLRNQLRAELLKKHRQSAASSRKGRKQETVRPVDITELMQNIGKNPLYSYAAQPYIIRFCLNHPSLSLEEIVDIATGIYVPDEEGLPTDKIQLRGLKRIITNYNSYGITVDALEACGIEIPIDILEQIRSYVQKARLEPKTGTKPEEKPKVPPPKKAVVLPQEGEEALAPVPAKGSDEVKSSSSTQKKKGAPKGAPPFSHKGETQ